MNTDAHPTRERSDPAGLRGEPVDAIGHALVGLGESERFRVFAALFERLAAESAQGAAGARNEQFTALSKKLQKLGEERASIEDLLASTKADLGRKTALLEAEQTRAAEQDRIIQEQRARINDLLSERGELDAKLVERAGALHDVERQNEQLLVRAQRAEARASDQSRVDIAESGRRDVTTELSEARERIEQLRLDKDAEIEKLRSELTRTKASASQGAEAVLAGLWEKLARAKPHLVQGTEVGVAAAADRLAEGYVELVHFADQFDKAVRVFLDKYTKYNPSIKVPWEVYAKSEDVLDTARQTLAVKGGRPAALLKMRMRMLSSWVQAAMIGSDSAIESIASELETHLRAEHGMAADPNRKIKDYLREDGHYLFMERIRELRSQRLAETFGRSG
jgi:hypothetical protein